jgi:hypothetical protein
MRSINSVIATIPDTGVNDHPDRCPPDRLLRLRNRNYLLFGRHTIKGLGGKMLTVMVASERAKIAPPEYATVSPAAVTATTAAFRVGLSAPLSFDCRFLAVHKASTGLR